MYGIDNHWSKRFKDYLKDWNKERTLKYTMKVSDTKGLWNGMLTGA